MKNKIITTDAENALDKVQHCFIMNLNKDIDGMHIDIIKAEKITFPLRSEIWQECLLPLFSLKNILQVLTQVIAQEKKKEYISERQKKIIFLCIFTALPVIKSWPVYCPSFLPMQIPTCHQVKVQVTEFLLNCPST